MASVQLAITIYAFFYINVMDFREFCVFNLILNISVAFTDTLGEGLAMKIVQEEKAIKELEKDIAALRHTGDTSSSQE